MTSLTSSPLLIALMQTAASLPVLLLGLLAGATADIFDRRKLLIFWQTWMLGSVLVLAFLTWSGIVSPFFLLALTLMLNIGSAMSGPAWQAIVPELVPRSELPDAIALNSAAYNLARAVGPALGGLTMAAFVSPFNGGTAVFFSNAVSFGAVIWVLYTWKRTPLFKSVLPSERIAGSMRTGLRYVRHAPALQAVLIRAVLFTLFASAVWALLAVVAQQDLQAGAMGYGILNGCLGAGAVAGAISLPKIRRLFSTDTILASASAVFVLTLLILAFAPRLSMVVPALLAAGFAWTTTTSTMNVAVQLSVPAWVQARSLGTYQMVFQGGMAVGSAMWGLVAEHSSSKFALLTAAGGLLLSLPLAFRFHLLQGELPDLKPFAINRPTPQIMIVPHPDDGPILVTVEYCVRAADYHAFTKAIHQLRDVRLRDGAIRWGIFQDAASPDRFVETFVVNSWLEYLRQRERLTAADREIRDRVWSYHQSEQPPAISHMIYARQVAE